MSKVAIHEVLRELADRAEAHGKTADTMGSVVKRLRSHAAGIEAAQRAARRDGGKRLRKELADLCREAEIYRYDVSNDPVAILSRLCQSIHVGCLYQLNRPNLDVEDLAGKLLAEIDEMLPEAKKPRGKTARGQGGRGKGVSGGK